jgi:hypothetical protein
MDDWERSQSQIRVDPSNMIEMAVRTQAGMTAGRSGLRPPSPRGALSGAPVWLSRWFRVGLYGESDATSATDDTDFDVSSMFDAFRERPRESG